MEQIPNFLIKRAYLTPERIALKFREKDYTFKDLLNMSSQVAGNLNALGVKKGDFIAVLLKNHVDTVVIFLALQLVGAKSVILNNRLTVDELEYQIRDSSASLLITENTFSEVSMELTKRVSTFKLYKKQELRDSAFSSPVIVEEVDLNDVCSIMYTSGTTGFPKGVLQTYGNHWWSAMGSMLNLGLSEKDSWLCSVPLFHISGYSILMRGLIYGLTIVLHESFDEIKTIDSIKKDKVTIMSVVSTMLTRILGALESDKLPDHFRCMLLGGGPASLFLLESCVSKNVPVYQTYGMTETSSQIVTLSPEDSIKKLGSAGKPLFSSQIKIVDSQGNEMINGESGEILVKGPNVTAGYLNRVDETREKINAGWLSTGDIGYMDEEGFLYVLDRRSDLIISGGENIYPAELEGILTSHPDIVDAGVIGIDHSKWGQVPIAFVVTNNKVVEEQIVSFCHTKLAKYKTPKQIIFIDEIPRNASKKILRRKLRELYKEGTINDY